jgi:hypothetical protein
LLVLLVTAATFSSSRHADKRGGDNAGAVYTETNDPSANQVVVFNRYQDGLIVQSDSVSTGGKGIVVDQPGCNACPFLDDQGSVALNKDGHLLFAVNAGSNTISTFRVGGDNSLTLVGQTNSGGTVPNSVTTHDNLVYVLNTGSLNIAGFKVSGDGNLTPIPGSNRPLTSDAHSGPLSPRQIGFDNTGKVLAVTLLGENGTPAGPGNINTFVVGKDGAAGSAQSNDAAAALPFAFSYDRNNHLVVAEANDFSGNPGKVTSYNVSSSGHLTAIDTESTGAFAPCWVAISKDGFAYVVNTGAGVPPHGGGVAAFQIDDSGHLNPEAVTPNNSLGTAQAPGQPPSTPAIDVREFFQTDITLSRDGQYAYVVSPGLGPVSHIDEYDVNDDGTLSLFAVTPSTLAGGLSGLAGQ